MFGKIVLIRGKIENHETEQEYIDNIPQYSIFKHLFCRHEYEVSPARLVHGGMEKKDIHVCRKCGYMFCA